MKEAFRKICTVTLMAVAAAWVGTARASIPPQVTVLPAITDGISTPIRIAVDPAGNVYAADPRGGGILKFSGTGRLLQTIPTAAPPQGVAVAASGTMAVSEGTFVALLDQSGKELRRLGSGAGQFRMANGIVFDDTGRIYVVDSLDNCVQVFSPAGDYLTRFGVQGGGSGQLNMPTGIAFEKVARQLAVADTLNGRIQFFDTNGAYQRTVCSFGSGPLKLTFPLGVAFEYTGGAAPAVSRMYVSDSFQGNVQALDPAGSGSFLAFVGGYGTGDGQLITPSDAAFDAAGSRLIVANAVGSLTVFGIGDTFIPVDNVPPVLTLNPLPPSTIAASQTVSGTVDAGATVTVAVNGGAAASAVVAGGSWSATVSLAPGANTITVKATDVAGNVSTATAAITLSITNFSIDSVPALLNVPSVTLSGQRTAGVAISVANTTTGAAGSVSYPTSTTWRSDVTGLAEGDNLITVSGGGNSENVTVTVDTRPPVLTVSAIPAGSVTPARVQNVTVRVADPHLDKVTVNGNAAPVSGGLATAAVTLANGATTITVAASDLAGNITTDTRSVTFDSTVPGMSIAAPADGVQTRTPVIELSGTVAANTTVTVNGAAALMNGTSWSKRVNLVPGLNTVTVTATDLSGKVATLKRSVLYDAALPQLAIAAPAEDGATAVNSLAVSGNTETGVTVTATVNGKPLPVTASGTSFSFALPLTVEGPYAVAVTASDATGATSVVKRNVTGDRTPPLLLVTSPTVPVPSVISGAADRDATVTATDRSGAVTVIPAVGGTWSLDLSAASLDPGTVRVAAADAAGNTTARTLAAPLPTGDVNGDGKVNISDVIEILKVAVGIAFPTSSDFANGDVGPLANGKAWPDGRIDLRDVILVLRKAVGTAAW
ncbi:Ig-like domain-containing protein [Geobacter sp.]|uniref:6-bladed beta-propeller n=1 Tax=Geobacter sp. TaxID=46610 RepID=UPI00262751AB|nr:Ig-like domain-containing protein [Geobacter sp.]